jgi:predicted nucleic acid-binding protein
VVYWDASAILSALFRDDHSAKALQWARRPGSHFISSLAATETHAVIARLERERATARVIAASARETLATGPWRAINVTPAWDSIEQLAKRWPLRGADLWHLAAAKSLHADLPELVLLSYDTRLSASAQGEGLAPP